MKNLKQGALTSFFSRSDKKTNPENSERTGAAHTTPSMAQNGSRDLKKARTLTDMQRGAEQIVKMEAESSIGTEIKVEEEEEPEITRNKKRILRKEDSGDDSEFDLSELQVIIDESEASAYSEESAKKRKTLPASFGGTNNSRKSGLAAQRRSQATPLGKVAPVKAVPRSAPVAQKVENQQNV